MKEVTSLNNDNKGKIFVSNKAFSVVALSYLVLPVIVFLLGWLRLPIAIPASLLLLGAMVLFARDCDKTANKSLSDDKGIEVSIVFLVTIVIVSVLLTVISNIGEYVWGTTDHAYRRAIFRDLVNYKWPVIYDLSTQSNPVVNAILPDTKVGFAYYFTFWMVPAVFGKLFGFGVGNIVLVIWSAIGIALTLIGMALIIKKSSYAVIFTYIFVSGLDIIPYFYFQSHGTQEWMWLEGYTEHIVYISNINNLLNVFNQCIPCWLVVVLLMLTCNNRSIGLIGAVTFAYSPWATIGMVPLAVYYLIRKEVISDRKTNIKNILSPLNIVPAVLMLAIFAPMYMANSNATSVSGLTWNFYGGAGKFILGYLFVVVVEVVPFVLLLGKDYGRKPIFWVVVGTLLVMPFYKISGQNDFTMRGSMPEFFVFTIMLADVIARVVSESKGKDNKSKTTSQSLKFVGAVLIIITMSFVAFQMLLIVITSTFDGSERYNEDIYSLGDVKDEEYIDLIDEQFYVYEYENSFFYKYMSRRV